MRQSTKQTTSRQKYRNEPNSKSPSKVVRNEATQTLSKGSSRETDKQRNHLFTASLRGNAPAQDIAGTSFTSNAPPAQAVIVLSSNSKTSTHKTAQRSSNAQSNKQSEPQKQMQKKTEKFQKEKPKQSQASRQTKEEVDDNKKKQTKPGANDHVSYLKEGSKIPKSMLPSYQSSNFDKRSSG